MKLRVELALPHIQTGRGGWCYDGIRSVNAYYNIWFFDRSTAVKQPKK